MAYARFLVRYPAIGKVKFEKNKINNNNMFPLGIWYSTTFRSFLCNGYWLIYGRSYEWMVNKYEN